MLKRGEMILRWANRAVGWVTLLRGRRNLHSGPGLIQASLSSARNQGSTEEQIFLPADVCR